MSVATEQRVIRFRTNDTKIVINATSPIRAAGTVPDPPARMHDGVRDLHAAIAASVPRGEQRVLDDAQHQSMHIEHPDAVLHAIRDLLDEAREQ